MNFNPLRPLKGLVRGLRIGSRIEDVCDLVEPGKPLWHSKTFWVNLLVAIASLLQVLPLTPDQALFTLAVVNIVLRVLTTTPLSVAEDLAVMINKLPSPKKSQDKE